MSPDSSGESRGEVRDRFETDSVFMCTNCTVVRWGDPHDECPACGSLGVDKLELAGDSDE
jgi:rubrerythrin